MAGRACRAHSVGRACRDLVTAILVGWLAAEAAHARVISAPSAIPANAGASSLAGPPAPDTLIVLGCPSDKRGRPSAMQRWRVDLAARNASAASSFVFTGAHEADVMAADLLARYGIDPARIVLEHEATNTWENIGNSAELIALGGVVRVVSDPLHARRGERYWRLQHPERADELRPADLYRFGEHPLFKIVTAAYEVLLRSMRYRPTG